MKNKKQEKLVAGYVRTATVSQDRNGLSTEIQGEKIREFCKAKGYRLSKMFSDSGCSGANLNRPAFKDLSAKISKGKISKVICLDRSRLSRNVADFPILKSLFKKHDVELVFLSDTSASEDTYFKYFDEMMAIINSFQSRSRECEHKQTELTNPVASSKNGGDRMTHHVRITVRKKDLEDLSKFKEMLEDGDFYGCTCGLSRSQIVFLAKILRLNLENTTEVKAEIQF